MTIRELIAELKKMPRQDAPVRVEEVTPDYIRTYEVTGAVMRTIDDELTVAQRARPSPRLD